MILDFFSNDDEGSQYEELPEEHMMRRAYEQLFNVAIHGSGAKTWSSTEGLDND